MHPDVNLLRLVVRCTESDTLENGRTNATFSLSHLSIMYPATARLSKGTEEDLERLHERIPGCHLACFQYAAWTRDAIPLSTYSCIA